MTLRRGNLDDMSMSLYSLKQTDNIRSNPQSVTSGKAGGLKKVEPLKADRSCEPLKAVRL
jgi:hypothetical protein